MRSELLAKLLRNVRSGGGICVQAPTRYLQRLLGSVAETRLQRRWPNHCSDSQLAGRYCCLRLLPESFMLEFITAAVSWHPPAKQNGSSKGGWGPALMSNHCILA